MKQIAIILILIFSFVLIVPFLFLIVDAVSDDWEYTVLGKLLKNFGE